MAIFNSYVSHNQRVISKYGFSKNPQVSLDDLGVHRSSTLRALCRRPVDIQECSFGGFPSRRSPGNFRDDLGVYYIYIYYIYIYQIISSYVCYIYGWVAQMASAFFGSVQSCDFHGLIGLAARPERFRS